MEVQDIIQLCETLRGMFDESLLAIAASKQLTLSEILHEEIVGDGYIPVSYTHLDVYKRQLSY